MIFLGVTLLAISITLLFGSEKILESVREINLEGSLVETKEEYEERNYKNGKGIILAIIILLSIPLRLIFLIWALNVDIYLYPTLILLLLMIIQFAIVMVKFVKQKANYEPENRTTIKIILSKLGSLLNIAYILYILYLVIF